MEKTMRYIQGLDRHQSLMFPELLDEYITEYNSVRFIDAFVDGLNLLELGFTHSSTSNTGRKPYHPADLLKLYIYGYLNKIRSSRFLEKSTYNNVEVMWLVHKLRPDFKTIADFRKDNNKALKKVFREFVKLCTSLDLFGCELIAIDGSKFSAVNHNDRNFTKDKLKNLLKEINEQIDDYFAQLDQSDEAESGTNEPSTKELRQKIDQLKKQQAKLEQVQQDLKASDQNQISQTDPDSRMMKSNKRSDVSYNVQLVTDEKHKLIVDFDVTNDINDLNQLSNMAIKAKKILGVDEINATADTGYHNETEIAKCEQENITCYIPKPRPSSSMKSELFAKSDFTYDSQNDCYICPAKQVLSYVGPTKWKNKKDLKKYVCQSCKRCELRSRCMGAKRGNRYIYRGIHENLIDQMERRMKQNPSLAQKRKELVEHPFGTIKHWMDQSYFLTRGFEKVTGEMSLTALCYNIKRVLNILDVKELIAVAQQLLIERTNKSLILYNLNQLKSNKLPQANLIKFNKLFNAEYSGILKSDFHNVCKKLKNKLFRLIKQNYGANLKIIDSELNFSVA
jgi:transposase